MVLRPRRGSLPELPLGRTEAHDQRTKEDLTKQALDFMERIPSRLKPDFGRTFHTPDEIREDRDTQIKTIAQELSSDVWLTGEANKQFWKKYCDTEHMVHNLSFEELASVPRWKRVLRHPIDGPEADIYAVCRQALQNIIASPKTRDYERQVDKFYQEGLREAQAEQIALAEDIRYKRAND